MPQTSRILVTGATGFVGRHLIDHLRTEARSRGKRGPRIFGTCFPERPEACAGFGAGTPRIELVHLDLRDAEAVERAVGEARPDRVYHLAAVSQVQASWEKRLETIETNFVGTFHLFEAVRKHAPRARVLFISTSDVYGYLKPHRRPFRESERGGPVSPYALTKIGGELEAELYARTEGLAVIIARPFPHTGPGQSPAFVCPDWARQVARIEAGEAPPVIRVGNLAIRREYMDVRDVVRAYTLLLEKGRPGEAYNVCTGRAPTLRDILRTLLRLSPAKIAVEKDPARVRKTDIPVLAGDPRRLRRATGWKPRIPLETTLSDLLDEWRRKTKDRTAAPRPSPAAPNPVSAGRVLVTGGAGYIGSLLVGELLRRGCRVTVADNLEVGGNALLAYLDDPNFSFLRADVRDPASLAPCFDGVDRVVHLAAIVGYPACAKSGRETAFAVNLEGTRNVFELAEKAGAKRFVFASTYSNYGLSPDGLPVTEDSPLFPQSVYAESKIAAERHLLDQAGRSPVAPLILRFATLFGPSPRTRFDLIINQFAWEAVTTGKLVIYQRHFNRSFVHVRDVVGAVLRGLEAPEAAVRGRVYNVGSNAGNYTKEGIVDLLKKRVPGLEVEYRDLNFDGDMRDIRVAFDRIESGMEWRASIGVEDGVREMVEAVRSGFLRR